MSLLEQRVELLRNSDLFAELDGDSLKALAQQAVSAAAARGDTLFRAGDPADGLRIVTEGLLRIWIDNDEGREHTLALAEPGDALGEIALLDGMPRTANATALEDTSMIFIRRSAFVQALENNGDMKSYFIALLCERLRANTDEINSFAFLPLRRRVRRKLYDLALSHAVMSDGAAVFRRRFSQTELSSMLGVTREAVNKQLASLTSDGLVSLRDGRIVILDLDALLAE